MWAYNFKLLPCRPNTVYEYDHVGAETSCFAIRCYIRCTNNPETLSVSGLTETIYITTRTISAPAPSLCLIIITSFWKLHTLRRLELLKAVFLGIGCQR